ncbi:Gpb1p Ecym_5007 [Eremothecium cymbalariae DBVPG|uniref:Uncharacterized protein n=1 Tax=Eremothecium cymbalariae (strain CBS 270.75 / DBVPG 7215 / KCTC 17166 / NRRL Y-17582) TaxID=931890 RepID=I6NCL8_ERECY|nr:hypothetical protein Ecym_5007 [Eremothecium cymbalariae DBVPG\
MEESVLNSSGVKAELNDSQKDQRHHSTESSKKASSSQPVSDVISDQKLSQYSKQYTAPKISAHYKPVFPNDYPNEAAGVRKARNEVKLKMYYRSRNVSIHPLKCTMDGYPSMNRRNMLTRGSSGTQRGSGYENDVHRRNAPDFKQVSGHPLPHWPYEEEFGKLALFDTIDNEPQLKNVDWVRSYLKYYDKLSTVNRDARYRLRSNNMWNTIPKVDVGMKDVDNSLGPDRSSENSAYSSARLDYFDVGESIDGSAFYPSNPNFFSGTSLSLPTFGDVQLPCFVYHSAAELKSNIYILGGLEPSFEYNEVAPNLNDFHMDGIKNLPPPINDEYINNPAMLPNKHLYVYSTNGFTLKRPKLKGQIPPPLICAKMAKLTDRYLFYYGGFEIRNETIIDNHTGQYYISRRAFINNTAYIFDSRIFKFTKVELITQSTKFSPYRPTVPRFGHTQVSLKLNLSKSLGRYADSEDGKSISSSIPTQSYPSSVDDDYTNTTGSDQTLSGASSASRTHVHTILIMGGYRQVNDSQYEALNDMWRLDVTVVSKGRKGYFQFAETALATLISKPHCADSDIKWPTPRGFMAACLADTSSLNTAPLLDSLLKTLKESEVASVTLKDESTQPVFSNLPFSHNKGRHSMSQEARKLSKITASQYTINKTLVVHGGSNGTHVYGDMWWFDLDSEQWTEVPLLLKNEHTKQRDRTCIPVVGHELVQHNSRFLILGGIHQQDVDKIYFTGKNLQKESVEDPEKSTSGVIVLTSSNTNSSGNTSNNFKNCVSYDVKTIHTTFPQALNPKLVAACAICIHGQLWLIGGAVVLAYDNRKHLQLLGNITELIVPLVESTL